MLLVMDNIQFENKFDFIIYQVELDSIATIVYIDCAKLGVLNGPEINAVGETVEKLLFRNPSSRLDELSCLFTFLWGL